MEIVIFGLVALIFIIVLFLFKKIIDIQTNNNSENIIKNEFIQSRTEINSYLKDSRGELNQNFKDFADSTSKRSSENAISQKDQLDTFSNQLINLSKIIDEKLEKISMNIQTGNKEFKLQIETDSKDSRNELNKSLKSFEESFNYNVKTFNETVKTKFDELNKSHNKLTETSELKLDKVNETLERKLKSLQEDNSAKLDKMRETVDEKLHSTLEKRLGESFQLVNERLEQVHKGLGEMQNLAIGVGDIKKVLSNIKTRGVLGEYQLENLLNQLLTVDQYSKNVKVKKGSNASVEFAVKLPGRDNKENSLWLPIDSKFPTEDYHSLLNAYESGNAESILDCKNSLAKRIKECAKDIKEKYLDPPNTTDFAILFLPFEGLYAEVLNCVGLFETMQRENKVVITGPTTLSAILNSLQMGFRTLAIEKRSSEVWEILGNVKKEFNTFGDILDKTKKKLDEAATNIDKASVRSRSIERKLKDVQVLALNSSEATAIESNENSYGENEEKLLNEVIDDK